MNITLYFNKFTNSSKVNMKLFVIFSFLIAGAFATLPLVALPAAKIATDGACGVLEGFLPQLKKIIANFDSVVKGVGEYFY